jgi:hypothetical protein
VYLPGLAALGDGRKSRFSQHALDAGIAHDALKPRQASLGRGRLHVMSRGWAFFGQAAGGRKRPVSKARGHRMVLR